MKLTMAPIPMPSPTSTPTMSPTYDRSTAVTFDATNITEDMWIKFTCGRNSEDLVDVVVGSFTGTIGGTDYWGFSHCDTDQCFVRSSETCACAIGPYEPGSGNQMEPDQPCMEIFYTDPPTMSLTPEDYTEAPTTPTPTSGAISAMPGLFAMTVAVIFAQLRG